MYGIHQSDILDGPEDLPVEEEYKALSEPLELVCEFDSTTAHRITIHSPSLAS